MIVTYLFAIALVAGQPAATLMRMTDINACNKRLELVVKEFPDSYAACFTLREGKPT